MSHLRIAFLSLHQKKRENRNKLRSWVWYKSAGESRQNLVMYICWKLKTDFIIFEEVLYKWAR